MKKVILCPNPYRDNDLVVAKQSKELLEQVGFETVVCLPFQREGYDELGMPIRPLQQEIKSADLLLAFGGDDAGNGHGGVLFHAGGDKASCPG